MTLRDVYNLNYIHVYLVLLICFCMKMPAKQHANMRTRNSISSMSYIPQILISSA